jgi:two-component system sensor histidine kinase KdpD
MLVVGVIIGELTARLGRQASAALAREDRTKALYGIARELSGVIGPEQVAGIVRSFVADHLDAIATLLLPDASGRLVAVGVQRSDAIADPAPPQRAFESGRPSHYFDGPTGRASLALPLAAPIRTRGVLVVSSATRNTAVQEQQQPLLDTVAALVAISVERLHFVEVARHALVQAESERLRNSLLSAVSHDLRTPLTVLVGLADSLVRAEPPLPSAHTEAAVVVREQALRLSAMVDDLLDMARLQVGTLELRREWQPLEEVIGSSMKAMEHRLTGRAVTIDLPPELPLVEIDAVLIERVLCNLLDNAAKYAPDSPLEIRARHHVDRVEVEVADHGSGVPPGEEEAIFRMFERGRRTGESGGAGMGLAICRAIVGAHGGTITASNRDGGGAQFAFTLPLGTPPALDAAVDERIAKGLV